MKINKFSVLALTGVMLLTGCSNQTTKSSESDKLSVVTTTFYEYDWVMEVIGDKKDLFDVTLLMHTGVDIHSYEPTAKDIITIKSADLFVYNGGHSHDWVGDVIAEPTNEDFRYVNIMESLGDKVKAEVSVEGMQNAHDHHESDEATGMTSHELEYDKEKYDYFTACCFEENFDLDEDGKVKGFTHPETNEYIEYCCESDGFVFDGHNLLGILVEKEDCTDESCEIDHSDKKQGHDDEHIWLSLHNAMIVSEILGEELGEIDSKNADTYEKNAATYIDTLEVLDEEYKQAIETANTDTLIFADRFPFLYLMDDYDINYYAAFQGCSSETEASFETVTFLAKKVDELNVDELLIIDNGLIDLAKTVNSSSDKQDCEILTLNSMQSISKEDIDKGATYYKYMQENLEVLKKALD